MDYDIICDILSLLQGDVKLELFTNIPPNEDTPEANLLRDVCITTPWHFPDSIVFPSAFNKLSEDNIVKIIQRATSLSMQDVQIPIALPRLERCTVTTVCKELNAPNLQSLRIIRNQDRNQDSNGDISSLLLSFPLLTKVHFEYEGFIGEGIHSPITKILSLPIIDTFSVRSMTQYQDIFERPSSWPCLKNLRVCSLMYPENMPVGVFDVVYIEIHSSGMPSRPNRALSAERVVIKLVSNRHLHTTNVLSVEITYAKVVCLHSCSVVSISSECEELHLNECILTANLASRISELASLTVLRIRFTAHMQEHDAAILSCFPKHLEELHLDCVVTSFLLTNAVSPNFLLLVVQYCPTLRLISIGPNLPYLQRCADVHFELKTKYNCTVECVRDIFVGPCGRSIEDECNFIFE